MGSGSPPEKTVSGAVVPALQASGFPFQTAIAKLINQSHPYRVVREEFPWITDSGDARFLDIYAQNEAWSIAVECKKTSKETLTFLLPDPNVGSEDSKIIRCTYVTQVQDSLRQLELRCADWQCSPETPESMYCVVSTSASGSDQRMLERDAQQVVHASDALAHSFRVGFSRGDSLPVDRLFIPIIVTNAPLYVAEYKTDEIGLEEGTFKVLPGNIRPVSWIRFRKAFTAQGGVDLGDRTVMVVHAPHFQAFLQELKIEYVRGALNPVNLPARRPL